MTTEEKRIKLVSQPNYHTTKQFSEDLLAIEMKKTKVKMNKPIYLGMSILDTGKTLMYEFWYDYIKSKYKDKAKLCYTDTDSFVINIFTEDFFEDINNDVERWFYTSNYDKNDKRPLQTSINEKLIGMFKDELGGKVMREFCMLRAKTYEYLMDDDSEKKKAKETKIWVIKREIMFKNYTDSLFNNTILRSQLRFKSDHHNKYTKEINNIALGSNDDKILQTSERIATYRYGTNACKVCESEMLMVKDLFFEKLQ